jgi:hypothetical protein
MGAVCASGASVKPNETASTDSATKGAGLASFIDRFESGLDGL